MLGHKASLNKFKRIENIQVWSLQTYWNKIRIHKEEKCEKLTNMQKLNKLLNNYGVKEEITMGIRKHFKMNEKTNTTYQN